MTNEDMMQRAREITTDWEVVCAKLSVYEVVGRAREILEDYITQFGQEMFERGAAQSSKPEWPSLEDVELHLAGNTQYYLGVQDCYRFLKQRMNQNESKKDGV